MASPGCSWAQGRPAQARPVCLALRPTLKPTRRPELLAASPCCIALRCKALALHGFRVFSVCRQASAVLQLPRQPGGTQSSHGGKPACKLPPMSTAPSVANLLAYRSMRGQMQDPASHVADCYLTIWLLWVACCSAFSACISTPLQVVRKDGGVPPVGVEVTPCQTPAPGVSTRALLGAVLRQHKSAEASLSVISYNWTSISTRCR